HPEFFMEHVKRMAGDVAQIAGAKVPPGAPVAVMVDPVVRPERRRAAPLVPIHPLGRGLDRRRTCQSAWTVGSGPEMNLPYLADRPAQEQFRGGPGRGGARILNA